MRYIEFQGLKLLYHMKMVKGYPLSNMIIKFVKTKQNKIMKTRQDYPSYSTSLSNNSTSSWKSSSWRPHLGSIPPPNNVKNLKEIYERTTGLDSFINIYFLSRIQVEPRQF